MLRQNPHAIFVFWENPTFILHDRSCARLRLTEPHFFSSVFYMCVDPEMTSDGNSWFSVLCFVVVYEFLIGLIDLFTHMITVTP